MSSSSKSTAVTTTTTIVLLALILISSSQLALSIEPNDASGVGESKQTRCSFARYYTTSSCNSYCPIRCRQLGYTYNWGCYRASATLQSCICCI